MKWMIASDLHGSYFYASQMQQAFEREQADRLLLLGDLLYHGPRNPLRPDYAPQLVVEQLNGLKERITAVIVIHSIYLKMIEMPATNVELLYMP